MEKKDNYINMNLMDKIEVGEVYDEVELSQINQLRELDSLVKEPLFKKESHPDFDGKHCILCDEPIPEKRLAHGRIHCVECQTILDKRDAKRF